MERESHRLAPAPALSAVHVGGRQPCGALSHDSFFLLFGLCRSIFCVSPAALPRSFKIVHA